jgi:hypothetical protein
LIAIEVADSSRCDIVIGNGYHFAQLREAALAAFQSFHGLAKHVFFAREEPTRELSLNAVLDVCW